MGKGQKKERTVLLYINMIQAPLAPHGVQRAAGSNPVVPTSNFKGLAEMLILLIFAGRCFRDLSVLTE